MRYNIFGSFVFIFTISFLFLPVFAFGSSTDGTIDSTYKYAWGSYLGWVNFGTTGGNVHITDSAITGYAWSDNYGWINLNPSSSGVLNDGYGDLSGYAWGENTGWIDFSSVTINYDGEFGGSASVDIGGAISFDCSNCAIKTDWRPRDQRTECNNTLDDDGDGKIDYPDDQGCASLDDITEYGEGGILAPLASSPSSVAPPPPLEEKKLIEIIKEIPLKIIDKVKEILEPKEQKPVEIPEEAPISLKGEWKLFAPEPIREFVLSPLPKEIRDLARKFPELERVFEEVGITKVTDLLKLKSAALSLPGISKKLKLYGLEEIGGIGGADIAGRPFSEYQSLVKGIPLAKLSQEIKKKIPTEIVFARTANELIDFNISLAINDKGKPEQRISIISGKTLYLAVKPESSVKSVKGYMVFRKGPARTVGYQMPLEYFTASLIFSNPSLSQKYQPKEIEEHLLLLEFEYKDEDNDGIYTVEIQAPVADGEYEIITVMDYVSADLGTKEIRLITVVDPEGYVYEKQSGKETRIPLAVVSLYWLNPKTSQYEIWPASEYQQENPQITDITGKYSFLAPQGVYYIKVETPGYLDYEGKPFELKEGSGIHKNIELKTKYHWLKVVDWRTILLIFFIALLLYNFYRDRIREKIIKQQY